MQRYLGGVAIPVLAFCILGARGQAMSKKKALAVKYLKAGSEAVDIRVLDEILADDFIDHQTPNRDLSAVKKAFLSIYETFPDLTPKIEDTIAEGNRVAVRVTWEGSHTGRPVAGMEPTGKRVRFTSIDIFHIEGDKIQEHWSVDEGYAIITQLKN